MTAGRHTIIRGGRVLDLRTLRAEPADVRVRGDTIEAVGPPGLAAPDDAAVVDAAGRLLVPGLVNAHTHGHSSLSKGLGDRWSLELLLNAGPWMSGERTLEHKRLAAKLNAAEALRKGCTAVYDLYLEVPVPTAEGLEAVARAYDEVGVRAVVAPMMADRTFYEAIPGLLDALPGELRERVAGRRARPYAESLEAPRRLLRDWPVDRERVRPALAPTIPLHCSDDFVVACRDLAREHGVGLHMHLAESRVQAVAGLQRYGHTLTEHLDALGFLGPDFTAAHAIWLSDDDLRRLADRGAAVAHNPGSNLRLGSGVARVRDLLDAGVTVGIGTDGSSCSDHQNMFEAMRMAAFVSRIETPDTDRWLGTAEVLRAATTGSARTLGFGEEVGTLAPEHKADIVFLDLAHINYVPLNDAANQLVNSEDGAAVDSVMVGGRMVLDRGRFTGFDYDALRRDVQAAAEAVREAGAEARGLSEALAPHINRFCVGLSAEPYPVQRWVGTPRG